MADVKQPNLTEPTTAPLKSPTQTATSPAATYSVDEVALILGLSKHTIYRLLARRLLKALPGLRVKRITDTSVKRYLES